MTAPDTFRLADLLAGLSLAIDLAIGHPPGEAMRACLLATALARTLGLAEGDVTAVYYTALLQHVGCTAFRHEAAALFGRDDDAFVAAAVKADPQDPREVFGIFLPDLVRGLPHPTRARTLAVAVTRGGAIGRAVGRATCEVAAHMAGRLQLPPTVVRSLHELFERWDGQGVPQGLAGEAIAVPVRFAHVAAHATLFHRLGGPAAAAAVVRRRAGRALDPAVAALFLRHGERLLAEVDAVDPTRATVAAEPRPWQEIGPVRMDTVLRAFADFVDLKSPFTHGHSSGTAALAARAAGRLRLDAGLLTVVRRGGLLHDLGRVAVPTSVWERPGPLPDGEWEQVRLHPYHGERILARAPVLAPLAPVGGMHHERLDGSGYYGRPAAALPAAVRVVAAADVFQAMTQARPHRPALAPDAAAACLTREAARGRLDTEAVAAVLAEAGHAVPVGRTWPAGLSDRQVEVLRLVAAGCSNRELASRLSVSPRTAEHHVQDIYVKIGVSSRAAAAMFAMEHDLLPPGRAG